MKTLIYTAFALTCISITSFAQQGNMQGSGGSTPGTNSPGSMGKSGYNNRATGTGTFTGTGTKITTSTGTGTYTSTYTGMDNNTGDQGDGHFGNPGDIKNMNTGDMNSHDIKNGTPKKMKSHKHTTTDI